MAPAMDPTSLSALRSALVRQARAVLGDPHEAEDVAQDALVALATTKTSFTDLDHVAAYARRTVHNLCVDRIRRRVRFVGLDEVRGSYDSVETDVITREQIGAVVEALAQLNPIYAKVLVASTDVGRNHAAIAELTGVSLRNVRHGLDRGSKALRAKLAAAGHAIGGAVPLPVTRLLAGLRLSSKSKAATAALPVLALPTLLLLLPPLHGGGGAAPRVDPDRHRASPRVAISTADVESAQRELVRLAGHITLVPGLDHQFAEDSRHLLHDSSALKDSGHCYGAAGHGACPGETAPGDYITIPLPVGPPIQVYDAAAPCSSVPSNPLTRCEPAERG